MSASAVGSELVAATASCLAEFGYPVTVSECGSDFRFEAVTEDGRRWRTQLVVHEAERLVQLYVLTDVVCSAARRAWMVEVVARVNESLVLGSFDLHWETCDVRFRNCMDFRGREASADGIEKLLASSAYPLSLWSRIDRQVSKRKVSAQAAVEAARIFVDTWGSGAVRPQTRRALLELV